MVGVFDYYAGAAFDTIESQFGESITFISGSGAFADFSFFGIIDNTTPRIDEYGNVVIEENISVLCKKTDETDLVNIGDSIRIEETGKVYQIINIVLDVNASKVFHVSE